MTPRYDFAATAAYNVLIDFKVSSAPIDPLKILKTMKGVLVVSYAEMADKMGYERASALHTFGEQNRDAMTTVKPDNGKLRYIVVYNQRMPYFILQRSLARELAHIVLKHDGSLPESIRQEEALCFARHLLCPRPLIASIESADIPITIETIGNITGCYERCMIGIRHTPGVHVAPALNRTVRDMFFDYVNNFIDCRSIITSEEYFAPVDFGTFMDNYEE